MKIGRNESCPCGSGKKYKKCCLIKQAVATSQVSTNKVDHINEITDSHIMKTITGEISHPVRLHYKVKDKKALQSKLQMLKCMRSDPDNERWAWLYTAEAKKLTFGKPYSEIPKHLQPIVIGSLYKSKEKSDEMHLDLRSIERAKAAFTFFDKHIGREFAELAHVSVSYRLVKQDAKNFNARLDAVFPEGHGRDHKREYLHNSLNEMIDSGDYSKQAELMQIMEEGMDDIYAETEFITIDFYEEGVSGQFSLILAKSLTVALARWNGNENITHRELIQKMMKTSG